MTPPITALLAIAGPEDVALPGVRSVLENEGVTFALRIADRSPDASAAEAGGELASDPRVTIVPTPGLGSTAAHNRAIETIDSDVVAITDRDCEVPSDWLVRIVEAFGVDPQVGVVFGEVTAVDHDPVTQAVPSYDPGAPFLARSVRDKASVEGIWACMAIRRRVWAQIGGFDEALGHGARFEGAADSDFAIRVLAAGHYVYETPAIHVVHHRVVPRGALAATVDGYSRATGAMFAKHLKCGTPNMPGLTITLARRWLGGRSHTALALGEMTGRRLRLGGFARGFARGAVTPVDREIRRFRLDT